MGWKPFLEIEASVRGNSYPSQGAPPGGAGAPKGLQGIKKVQATKSSANDWDSW